MKSKTNSALTIGLAVVIIFALFVVIYVNLPQSASQPKETVILSVTYNENIYNYTLQDLKNMKTYTDSGRMIKLSMLPEIVITSLHNYTGVQMITLLQDIGVTEQNYSLTLFSTDGYLSNYTEQMVQGYIEIYNETGSIIPNQTAIMLLTYAEDGSDYTNESSSGQLRITFVGNKCITSSKVWPKYLDAIKIKTS